jgi:hypothetical protein
VSDTSLVFDILARGGKEAAGEFLAVGAAAKKSNDQIAVSSRKMSLAVKESSEKAAKAQDAAKEAAKRLERGEISEAEAAEIAAKAQKAVERASIKAAEAELAAAKAADKVAENYKQLARSVELSAAAQQLAQLKASRSVKEHNALIRDLEARFGDLSKEGSGAFQMIETAGISSFSALESTGPLAVAGIAVGLATLPFLATAAAAGISLVLGGALTAVAIKSQLANKDVQNSFAGTEKYIADGMKEISSPFHQTLLSIASDGRMAFSSLEVSLSDAFQHMAPAVTGFSHQFAISLRELNPAIVSLGHSFSVVLTSFGSQLPTIMHNLAGAIKSISDAAAANPQAFTSLVTDVSELTRVIAYSIAQVIRYKDVISGFLGIFEGKAGSIQQIWKGIKGTSEGFVDFGNAALSASDAESKTGATTDHLKTSMDLAKLAAQQMTAAFDAASGKTLSEREALVQYRQSVTAMTQALKQNGQAHGFNTAKGAANEQALDGMATAAQKAAAAMKSDGKSAQDVSTFIEGARKRIIAAAEKMGYSSTKARSLANSLLGVTHAANTIPSGKHVNVTSNASAEARRINAMKSALDRLHNKTITITTYYREVEAAHHAYQAEHARRDGGIVALANGGMPHRRRFPVGGPVFGPGTSRSDSIPALLSNGEFVVNAAETAKNRALLEAINSGKLNTTGVLKSVRTTVRTPKPIGAVASASQTAGSPNGTIQLEWVGGNGGDELLKLLRKTIRLKFGGGSDSVQKALGS